MNDIKGFVEIDSYRKFYKEKLGDAPDDAHIYNYYLNMIDTAIQMGITDNDFNRMKFPHSIRTKQEMIKIIMIIQADARKDQPKPTLVKKPEKKPERKLFKWRKAK